MALSLDEALGMSLADEADESIHVDVNTRQITIPESQRLFGVESDADVEVKHIVIDGRYADGNRDLSELAWRVIYRNANKDISYYLIPSVVANENSIEMDWLIKRSVVAYKGTVDFILCAFATTSSGEVTPEWNSTLGQGIVLEGLETSAIDINKEVVDELAKILYETIAARDAAASSATDATKSQRAAAASERKAEASKNLAATSASNASASASAAAASETAAKASANKAQALVEGIPDDYATALEDISQLKENKLDKPNNPVVGQLLRVKSISDTGEITLETVADNDDNKLPTGGSTGQVLAKKSDESFDAEWVNAVAGSLPKGGYPGFILQKKSFSDFDAEWVSAIDNVYYGVDFSGSTSSGTRTGGAKDFVFKPGTDSDTGENSFDNVYPWKGMKRCCCSIGSDGEIKVNAYKGQSEYTEDGSNGEIFVEIPRFYVAGAWDTNPKVSVSPLAGFRAPKKFQKPDGTLRAKTYIRAFSGSIGSDNKLHSLPNVVPASNRDISQFTAAARLWANNVSIGTSEDAEVLIYLMIVVYGTRNFQEKIRGVSNLYATNMAITGARTSEAAITVAKNNLEPGMVISIGTGDEDESVAYRRIVTSVEEIAGDTSNVKVSFSGDPITTTTANKVWRIMQSTGTTAKVKATCGSPVSNTDGRHSFVFYGIENPLYGNQWRFEGDWKLVDGVAYYCNDPSKYNWSTVDDYIKLSDIVFPGEGWVTALQFDERAPHLQVTKSVGGTSGTYMGDYFWINKSGVRIVRRGGYSGNGDQVGPFYLYLYNDVGDSWWFAGADLSVPG